MKRKTLIVLPALMLAGLAISGCVAAPRIEAAFDPADLKFSAQRAFALETAFVTDFPARHTGTPNSRAAVEWLAAAYTDLGWDCHVDIWDIINYSRPVTLRNVVCTLSGDSEREILVIAHHDQASTTIQGADNDGSGIAILLHMAEIFAAEAPLAHTLVFVSTDAEEYGMLGTDRYIRTHPDPENIVAGLSLDNLGRDYYDGMSMELVGQYRQFSPLWIALTAQEAGRITGGPWNVYMTAFIDQITGQAAPVSFMDQGPLIAAGVPAVGFTGHVPVEFADEHYGLWHDPEDTMEHQSAEVLGRSGLIAEGYVRQLLGMPQVPRESGPYLYFEESGQVLRGLPLWAIFVGFTAVFFAGSVRSGRAPGKPFWTGWRGAMPHFLGLWLPLLGSIVLLYLLVGVGMLDSFPKYPATTKDPYLLNPRWTPIVLFFVGLAAFLYVGRRLAGSRAGNPPGATFRDRKSLSLFVMGLSCLYILAINPFSLLFLLPLLFWFLIRNRKGAGKGLDILFFVLGGFVVYFLIYFFGFVILRYNLLFLWYMLNMFSIRMISFRSAIMITAVIGAGLALVVNPPPRRSNEAKGIV